ncbi:MAG: lamin tail domain-containing protein [Deltaproteobacteria bacterium]|nr:lamin tail domain-containing protein [Deltaproteobacteria bacterium]
MKLVAATLLVVLALANARCRDPLALDFEPPRVATVSPLATATGVLTSTAVVVTFTEPMRASTLYDTASQSSDKIILVRDAVDDAFISDFNNEPLSDASRVARVVAATVAVSADGKTVTLTPTAALQGATLYTLLAHKDVKDIAGNSLVDDANQKVTFTSTFTTVAAFTVSAVIPTSSATGVAPNLVAIRVAFSPGAQAATITTTSFRLLRCGAIDAGGACLDELVAGTTVTSSDGGALTNPVTQADLRPGATLALSNVYKVALTETILSTSGTPLTASSYTFSTAAEIDTTAPVISNAAASPDETTCVVSWTTNEAATGLVAYGLASTSEFSAATAASGTSHAVTLTGLQLNTDYIYDIIATDAVGNSSRLDGGTFRTRIVPVVLNEILADPPADGGDANQDGTTDIGEDEFIEFVNTSGAGLDLSGWTLADATSVRFTFPTGSSVANGRAFVVFTGGDAGTVATDGGSNCVVDHPQFGGATICTARLGSSVWNNSGDVVTLKDADGGIVVSYGYDAGSDDNQSWTRVPEGTSSGVWTKHTKVPDAGGRAFSPGTRATGAPFP